MVYFPSKQLDKVSTTKTNLLVGKEQEYLPIAYIKPQINEKL